VHPLSQIPDYATATYDSVCKDNSWIHGKCRQRFFYPTFTNVFFYFLHVFNVFNVFFNFHLNVYYIYAADSVKK